MTQHTQLSTTIGMDVGDAKTHLCVMDAQKRILEERAIRTSRTTLRREFEGRSPSRVALEVGAHSRWMSALLTELGHTVQVVDPRRLDVIAKSVTKTDRKDARVLAALAVGVPEMLGTVRHRGEQAYVDRALLKSRDLLVRLRTTRTGTGNGASARAQTLNISFAARRLSWRELSNWKDLHDKAKR